MEPCGIASNFTGFGPLRRNFKTRENNPMHSRTGIDNKGRHGRPVPAIHGLSRDTKNVDAPGQARERR